MKRSTCKTCLLVMLSLTVAAEPVLARGFGGGGFRGGGGGGFHGGGGGGFNGGGGFHGGGGFNGGGGGFRSGGMQGGGLSGGGFHPQAQHTQMNRPAGNFGGGGGVNNRPFVVHQPNAENRNFTPGNRPPIQPGGGFSDRHFSPETRPGGMGRPGLPGEGFKPGNLPGMTDRFPGGNRPGSGTASLPGLGPTRPGAGGAGERLPSVRPGQGGAGEQLPGIRPGQGGAGERFPGVRPGQGGAGERFPGVRPGQGGAGERNPDVRPGQGGAGERWPNAGGGTIPERHQDLVDRFNDMNVHGGDSDWHHQQWVGPNGGEVNHFGYWGPNGYWGHTGAWGPNGGYWGHTGAFGPAGHWSRNWGWYNGYGPAWGNGRYNYLWNNYPVAMGFGATMWGLNAVSCAFGISNYVNPYYDDSAFASGQCPVSYAQPIIGDPQYETQADQPADGAATDPAAATPPDPLTDAFDAARQAFYSENFPEALNLTNQALKLAPQDAAMNEFRSLCLFALGQYRDSAATIHAVLAAGPGWNWTTLISLYSNRDTYTVQLRNLEATVKLDPNAADLRFLLAYHYLTCDQQAYAVKMWKDVVALQPNDQLAAHLVQMYEPADDSKPPAANERTPNLDKPAYPMEKLQGKWTAKDSGNVFGLTLNADDQFVWEFTQGGKSQTVKGVFAIRGNNLVLQPDSGGTMLSTIELKDEHTLAFNPIGDAKKLQFTK